MLEIPVEALIATYPRAIDVRGVTLRPMTLGDAILLSVLGVNFNAGTTEPQALMAGLLLSDRVDSESIFCEKVVTRQLRRLLAKIGKRHVDELHQAVDAIIDKSFLTKIKFAVPKGAPIKISPDGLGDVLQLRMVVRARNRHAGRSGFRAACGQPQAQRRKVRRPGLRGADGNRQEEQGVLIWPRRPMRLKSS